MGIDIRKSLQLSLLKQCLPPPTFHEAEKKPPQSPSSIYPLPLRLPMTLQGCPQRRQRGFVTFKLGVYPHSVSFSPSPPLLPPSSDCCY
ncbi:hypothetical protein ACTXT7_010596 [Hymenolepis weldensis]